MLHIIKKTFQSICIALLLILNSNSQTANYWPVDNWQYKTPEEVGMDHNILDSLNQYIIKELPYVYSYIIERHGYIVFEKYYNYTNASQNFCICSCTKSLTNIALGISFKDGNIGSVNDAAIKYLNNYNITNQDKRINNLTIRNLCTFTSGIDVEESSLLDVEYYMNSAFVNNPGEKFDYDTPASHVLSAVVSNTTGKNCYTLLTERLAGKINFENFNWISDENNVNAGGYGAYMRTLDMLKIGYLYINRGIWNGVQIVEPEWVDSSTVQHNQGGKPHYAGYGYNWWTDTTLGYNYYFAGGYGGQFIIVIPDLDIVVAIASNLDKHREAPRHTITSHVIPAIMETSVKIHNNYPSDIIVYPNPVRDYFYISFNENNIFKDIILCNIQGKIEYVFNNEPNSYNEYKLPAFIMNGTYLLQFSNPKNSFVKKIVIQP